jgi:hypothetical protein
MVIEINRYFQLWNEWDCGQEGLIFVSVNAARNWYNQQTTNIEALEDEQEHDAEAREYDSPYDWFYDCGLVALTPLTIIE